MLKHARDFLLHIDVMIMTIILIGGITLTIPQLVSPIVWLALISGLILYMIGEYTTHRFLFHMKPPKHPFLIKLIRRLHYDHHEHPNDLRVLFLPLWYTLPQFIIIGAILYALTQDPALVVAFITGSIGMLLYYEWTHFVAHRPITPLTPWGKWMKKYHLLHHYKNEHYWYGVTTPSLDLICGTYKDEKKVEKSETARKLDINM